MTTMTSLPIGPVSTRVRHSAATLALGVLLTVLGQAEAAVIDARSASRIDVGTAIGAAADGDTVHVPAGTASWTSKLTITKAITLEGTGIGQTIILDSLPASPDSPLIEITTTLGKSYRLTGFEFRPGARTTNFLKGCILISGDSKTVRWDHCKFDKVKNRWGKISGSVCGVVDHNVFISTKSGSNLFFANGSNWGGASNGDGSWAQPIHWGSAEAIYVEDNQFSSDPPDYTGWTDTTDGCRVVIRYNTATNVALATHGTGSSGRGRGLRHFEIYNNTFIANPVSAKNAIHIRGGTGVVFNNDCRGFGKFITLHTYRFYESFHSWGQSDGLSGWDVNDPAGIYLSGTAGTGSGNLTLVVTGANWTKDQWKGFTVRCSTSSNLYPSGYFHSCVVSNTNNTITVEDGSQIPQKPFAAGDHFEIRKVILSLDQVGASTGGMITDKSTIPAPQELNQTIEPVYVWNNKMNGVDSAGTASADSPIREGVHFFNKPKTDYTPYTYPHPLVTGTLVTGTPPEAPTNLKIVP